MTFINLFFISILIHILSAIAWLGSLVAIEFIFLPSLINKMGSIDRELVINTSKKFITISQISSLLILITGVYQTFDTGYFDVTKLFQTAHGNLIVIKVILYILFTIIGFRTGLMLTKIRDSTLGENVLILLKKSKNLLYIDLFIGLLIIVIAISLTMNV